MNVRHLRIWKDRTRYREMGNRTNEGGATYPESLPGNAKDGAYRAPLSTQSYLQTPHKANCDALYEKRFVFWRDIGFSPKAQEDNLDTEYLILRTRTNCDATGNILSAHYTKLVAPPVINQHKEAEVQLFYFYNATPNDPWLESDFDAQVSGRILRGAKRW